MASGLTHELIVNLTHAADLQVIGPIGVSRPGQATLGLPQTDFELRGSLWRSGQQIRLSVRLIETEGGTTVWANHYDREITVSRFFEIQDDLALQVVGSIAGQTGAIPKAVLKRARYNRPESVTAYEASLMQFHWSLVLTEDSFFQARAALEHAIKAEPDYALAKAMLADNYCSEHVCALSMREDALDRAQELAKEARELDPRCADARWVLGQIHLLRGRPIDFDLEMRDALLLRPYSSHIRGCYALFLPQLGRWDEAQQLIETAIHLCPEHPPWFHIPTFLKLYHEQDYLRAYEEALLIRTPGVFWGSLFRCCAAGQLKRKSLADDHISELLALQPQLPIKGRQLLTPLLGTAQLRAHVISGLSKAGLEIQR